MFTQDDKLAMEQLVEATNQIEVLKAQVKELNKKILKKFESENVNSCMVAGHNIVMSISDRVAFKKGMKDKFIADMNAAGKSHLVKINVDVDKDGLKTDMASGLISDAEVSQYISFSETKTLKVE